MTDDIYEPLALFRDQLKETHAQNVAAFFEELVQRSAVDEPGNQATVREIRRLEAEVAAAAARESKWQTIRTLLWIVVAISGVVGGVLIGETLWGIAGFVLALLGTWLALGKVRPLLKLLADETAELRRQLSEKTDEAWEQMTPLNRLYDWGMTASLIQQTVPRLELDTFFTNGRLSELRREFKLPESFNQNRSVLFSQSGAINGNPFVLGETLNFQMGLKTWTGTLNISWRERQTYTDSQGRVRTQWVTRHQTLHASVTKPAPEHQREKFLLYGNEAAPDLVFSRSPSELSHLGDSGRDRRRKNHEIKKLEKFSRNLDDDSGYTIMSNREFAALFRAVDRNHEVQYRLLFTPLAQEQMVKLLKDKVVGYGDDFSFVKERMINIIRASHLTEMDISAAPSLFHAYDLAAARRQFNSYNNEFFKAFYFALAPLLTIPIYQQHRSHADIYRDVYGRRASFWEHEALANFHGQSRFQHPSSVTPSILKTRPLDANDPENIAVTAHGFVAFDRTDYVSTLGGDGLMHPVPVQWKEYQPVSQTTNMLVREAEGLTLQDFEEQAQESNEWQEFFRRRGVDRQQSIFRRSVFSALPGGRSAG